MEEKVLPVEELNTMEGAEGLDIQANAPVEVKESANVAKKVGIGLAIVALVATTAYVVVKKIKKSKASNVDDSTIEVVEEDQQPQA